jgi:hypothetical protein
MKILPLLMMLFVGAAHATEVKISGAVVAQLLQDVELTANDGSKNIAQIFQKSGVTLYIVNGQQSQGFWRVEGDKYCSQWPPSEHWDCFDMTRNGNLIAFISVSGKRYEMQLPDPVK